ncbi:MAG: AAA family ATPase [Phycisphaerae bacterium]|nr:AAA family ATPase [Phycisphaerae bacterium]
MAIRTCIAIINEKGGTAKSTTSVNLSAALGELGQRVLLVDLDGQAASSRWVGVEEDNRLADAMTRGTKLQPIPNVLPNVSLIPASGRLDSIAHDLRPTQGGQMRKLLGELADDFDFIIIDCPPSLGNRLIANGMLAATHVIVPVETSILALDGLKILLTTLEDIREGFGHNLVLAGVLACRYDYRTRLSRLVLEELRRALPGKVFNTVIRENVRMRECPASGQSILTFAPDSSAAADYRALAAELLAPPQAWRKEAERATGQNSVENLRNNTSDKLLDGQRKGPPSALEVEEDHLDPNQELDHPTAMEIVTPDQAPQPAMAAAPAPAVHNTPAAPMRDEPAGVNEAATGGGTPAPQAAVAYTPPAVKRQDSPPEITKEQIPTPPPLDGGTDALAKWLDQLATAEKRITSQGTANEPDPASHEPPDIETDEVATAPAMAATPARIAPPESASHHTPTAPVPEARAATVNELTIPNMIPEPPPAFRTAAAPAMPAAPAPVPAPTPVPAPVAPLEPALAPAAMITPADATPPTPEPAPAPMMDLAALLAKATAVPEGAGKTVAEVASSLHGSHGAANAAAHSEAAFAPAPANKPAPAAATNELSMMEILAGVSAAPAPATPAPITPQAGVALPSLTDMPTLNAPTPPSAPPPKPTQADTPPPVMPAAAAPAAPVDARPANAPAPAPANVAPPPPASEKPQTPPPATEHGEHGNANGNANGNGDNFPALRAYLKQMQQDGKLPAKSSPQTTTEPRKSGGLRSLFRKVVGPK